MTDLHITWPDGDGRFSPGDSPVEIGRASGAAVPLTEGSVSRQHLSVQWDGRQWQVTDNSTHGTFDRNGVRLSRQWAIGGDVRLRLGGTEGVAVDISPDVLVDAPGPIEDLDDAAATQSVPSGGHGHADLFPPAGGSADQGPSAPYQPSSGPPGALEEPLFPVAESPGLLDGAGTPAVAEAPPMVRLESSPRVAPAPIFDADPSPGSGFDGSFGPAPNRPIGPNTTIISDSTLRLNVAGQDYSFLPGAEITVGRDPACLVQLDEQHSLVSRRHLRIDYRDGHWWLEDFSSKGTFVNHRQIKGRYKAEGAFIVNLGDDDAGTPMRVITAGEHRVPRSRTPYAVGALAVLTMLAIGAMAVLLTGRGSTVVEPDFTAAKNSTVMLFGLDGGQGSGFFVADDLILTNQHVAVLSPQLLVGVSRRADEPAQIEYATELVANHPFLDIAVLRIASPATITADGPVISNQPIGEIGLPPVTIGNSDDVTIGDAVFSTGFPGRLTITSTDETGALRLPSVVATSGEAVNFTIWPGCSNPDSAAFIPADSPPGVACSADGDMERGVLLSTFSSGQGASGSAVFHDNEVVAVVYAGAADEDNASLNITTSAFSSWLSDIIAANG
ncbi:MAG: FHA domain-containing protein [Actinomycetota bacterium]